ncbi:MAG: hypothetical protein NTW21_21810, partial [Verrucomicrobia bacterium]|nr:hypothetical protein [Verrucomicrobiota bacterium]
EPSARTHGPPFRYHHKNVVAPYRAHVTPGATPAHRVLMLRTETPNPGDDPEDVWAPVSAGI